MEEDFRFNFVSDKGSRRIYQQYLERTRTRSIWSVGLSGIVGAEWFVRRDISLTAEYRSDIQYVRNAESVEINGEEQDGVTESAFELDARGVRFGLSIYF